MSDLCILALHPSIHISFAYEKCEEVLNDSEVVGLFLALTNMAEQFHNIASIAKH